MDPDTHPTLAALRDGRLRGIRRLDLSCGLDAFPREIFDLADSLEVLNLTGNALHTLPDDLPRLHRLQVLFCSANRFTELPAVVGRCERLTTVGFKANRIAHVPPEALAPPLRWLILTDNAVPELPASIGRCTALQKLMLAGNALHSLPDAMAACRRLELLRLAANRFDSMPAWLMALPRLAWLALAGNPFVDVLEAAATEASPLPDIAWQDLALGARLGEGASGVIHQAVWQPPGAPPRPVAVKLFKGQVTSDGLPRSEMAACLAAQPHAQVIEVLGRVAQHPTATAGLAMRLIDPAFRNLAGPPSLDSCTRDVYAPDTRFSLAGAQAMARGVADAARHLHARGLSHGDLYAHNLLWNGEGEALLGDFGAASFVPPALAPALERVEVRAFGCLLEELLARVDGVVPEGLIELRARCLHDVPRQRPGFAEVAAALDAVA